MKRIVILQRFRRKVSAIRSGLSNQHRILLREIQDALDVGDKTRARVALDELKILDRGR